ncbi:YifB family Mg chelatase-like AAA ATPase [Hydrogenothermus marinus]|uniref:Magnesium chelatase family protein n=1 Tax=Hydrogenothermus marinus TaxID=133270 RepID=A0A3M0BMI5_9AQUI|nr:YifB family Mg chelatase-like AAA ATPase [Hydrogenothermus marinus]RMA96038.1 magnesium chelatase family protein [Hydrogenothermus marinus]
MLSIIKSGGVLGIDGYIVDVEVSLSKGLPQFLTVGLPDTAVKESKERVKSAITNSGFNFPSKKIVVNLAPADIQKQGTLYDLPIAIGILNNTGIINSDLEKTAFIGELALDGKLRKVKGVLPIALKLKEEGFERIILPGENENEAGLVKDLKVYGFNHLKEIVDFLNGNISKNPVKIDIDSIFNIEENSLLDFKDVKGQYSVKKALEIAAAGFHNLLMIGSPGSGKTMLARRFISILPPLTFEEAIETTKIHSVAGELNDFIIRTRPFIEAHHTASDVSIIGGGTIPKPGLVSLAHNGVLFLDELPEFKRNVLEVLRQPLEDKKVSVSRASGKFEFPANFQLIAAANPCPCGYKTDPYKECTCSQNQIKRYLGKISGPLLDRIDILVNVMPVKTEDLSKKEEGESSKNIRERVLKAVEIQKERFKDLPINFNSQMSSSMVDKFVNLKPEAENILKTYINRYKLTARSYYKILKVSRTLADLENKNQVETKHIIEAINYKVSEDIFS